MRRTTRLQAFVVGIDELQKDLAVEPAKHVEVVAEENFEAAIVRLAEFDVRHDIRQGYVETHLEGNIERVLKSGVLVKAENAKVDVVARKRASQRVKHEPNTLVLFKVDVRHYGHLEDAAAVRTENLTSLSEQQDAICTRLVKVDSLALVVHKLLHEFEQSGHYVGVCVPSLGNASEQRER